MNANLFLKRVSVCSAVALAVCSMGWPVAAQDRPPEAPPSTKEEAPKNSPEAKRQESNEKKDNHEKKTPEGQRSEAAPMEERGSDGKAQGDGQKSADPEADRKLRVAEVRKKMKHFDSHAGEWSGLETYTIAATGQKIEATDEWKGSFTLGGTIFEMVGKSTGPTGTSSYKWVVTYDVEEESYHAWNYDEDGSVEEYWIEWDEEEKALVWTSEREDEDRLIELILTVDGNEISGEGEISQLSDGQTLITTAMKYKRKIVSI